MKSMLTSSHFQEGNWILVVNPPTFGDRLSLVGNQETLQQIQQCLFLSHPTKTFLYDHNTS